MVALNKGASHHDPLFTLNAAQAFGTAAEAVFIGLRQDAPRFALALEPAAAEACKARPLNLSLGEDDKNLIFETA